MTVAMTVAGAWSKTTSSATCSVSRNSSEATPIFFYRERPPTRCANRGFLP